LTRYRLIYAVLLVIVIGLGLGSRRYSHILPDFIATYAGDTLWALMVFLLIGFIFPAFSTIKVAIIALIFSFSIELSQLYHAPWIDQLRQYRLMALIIGHGFVWTDWLCYTVGVGIGVIGESGFSRVSN
jgi:glycopeptide antibiotics resistance protein